MKKQWFLNGVDKMVKITNDYYFEKDDKVKNFTLYHHEYREKMTKFGKEGTGEMIEANTAIGFYPNIEAVLRAAADDEVNRKCNDGTITTINEYLAEYRKTVNELKDAINGNDTL